MYPTELPGNGKRSPLIILASLFMIAAGVVHLATAPQHWDHGSAHGLILGVSGVMEILWGLAFLFRPSPALYRSGFVLALTLITVWAITRWLPAPFGHHGPGGIDTAGVLSKLCEGLAASALVALAVSGSLYSSEVRGRALRGVGALATAAVLMSWASYGVARAVEPFISPAGHDEQGHHQEQHDHSDHEHHDH